MRDFTIEIDQVLELLRSKRRFVLTSHMNPDGDGLGCELALYHILRQLNKEVRIINATSIPEVYRFMDPDGASFNEYNDKDREFIKSADVIFVLDISVMHRLGAMSGVIENSPAAVVCIDHHSTNNFPGDILLIDENAVATGEIVIKLIKQGGFPITAPIAESLYISLLTDTGCFRFSNTNVNAHLLGAELLRLGANHQKIYHYLYENDSWEKTSLFALTLSTLKKEGNGKIARIHITQDMVRESGAQYEDIEGFAEFARNIKDVLISILFVEYANNCVKISFRSNNKIALDALAAEFGGGGHKSASAAVLENVTLAQAIEKIVQAALRYVKDR